MAVHQVKPPEGTSPALAIDCPTCKSAEFYERTYILGGWSGNVLRFASEMVKLAQ